MGNLYILSSDDERQVRLCEATLSAKTELEDSGELNSLSWVNEDELDYESMPDDYQLWLPHVLAGYCINAFLEVDDDQTIYGTVLGTREDGLGKAFAVTVPESNA